MRFLSFSIGILCIVLTSCSSSHRELGDYFTFEVSHGFEIFFDLGATKQVKDYYTTGSIVINGSYFGRRDSGAYYPAGLWRSGIDEISPAIFDDPNITHVVRIAQADPQNVTIFPNKDLLYMKWGSGDNAFQAGPLVLSDNILQDFGQSWHAREPHERTLIGRTISGKVYFFLSRKQISLTRAGEIISNNPIFQSDPITVLNLDGGPSTAYFDGEKGFRENEKLPIIFRIKK